MEKPERVFRTSVPTSVRLRPLYHCAVARAETLDSPCKTALVFPFLGNIERSTLESLMRIDSASTTQKDRIRTPLVRSGRIQKRQLPSKIIESRSNQVDDASDMDTPRGIGWLSRMCYMNLLAGIRITIKGDPEGFFVSDEFADESLKFVDFHLGDFQFESRAIKRIQGLYSNNDKVSQILFDSVGSHRGSLDGLRPGLAKSQWDRIAIEASVVYPTDQHYSYCVAV